MKKTLIYLFLISLFVVMPIKVMAHPGRTDANGGHTCNTSCAKWGLQNGEYHLHNGNTYTNSQGQVFNSHGTQINSGENSSNNTTTTQPKSGVVTITTVKVNNESIEVQDEMNYTSTSNFANIEVIATDSKATVDYEKNVSLVLGTNEVTIKVTAENKTTKTYKLIIIREEEKILSNKVGIEVNINGQEVKFDYLKKGNLINIGSKDKLDIQYLLEDPKATTNLKYDKEIKQGETVTIKFTVTAENGDTQDYEIEVYRYTTAEDAITTVVSIGVIGGLGYGTYRVVKKVKKKK